MYPLPISRGAQQCVQPNRSLVATLLPRGLIAVSCCAVPIGVQIFYFSEMLTIEGLGGLVPTLKFGSEMESTLHCVNSDDDP